MRNLPLLSLVLASCTTEPMTSECITTTLSDELGEPAAQCPTMPSAEPGKADSSERRAIESPGLRFLRARSERQLAALFARGSADAIPTGRNTGMPLLLGLDWLAPAFSQIYVGSIWEPRTDSTGAPILRPSGDPMVTLRDAWLRSNNGHLVTLFEADVTRSSLAAVHVAPNIPAPSGPSRPHPLLPIYRERLVIDNKPSLFVNYNADPAPVINRILDEIREVDPVNCPGLYLGRAHYRRPGGEWVYLYWFALDFGPAERACVPRMP